ncbi:hypothetical protein T459_07563 [Capsicum annuum]|uniref:Uncharacterized protein n=2 Tax=Capsicum annuum TaxID=4072 RepID=A0A075VTN0_CAPAN|nr:hypothetical protein [Capsicum annuum]AIG90183.1 hypothetical protein [Capsicum annuum]PHT85457.1 hypothetical protein T459_07563 [Capsicum annuum]QFV19672.1 hypothetical protein [Capsicum annuum var. glabriusculum]
MLLDFWTRGLAVAFGSSYFCFREQIACYSIAPPILDFAFQILYFIEEFMAGVSFLAFLSFSSSWSKVNLSAGVWVLKSCLTASRTSGTFWPSAGAAFRSSRFSSRSSSVLSSKAEGADGACGSFGIIKFSIEPRSSDQIEYMIIKARGKAAAKGKDFHQFLE